VSKAAAAVTAAVLVGWLAGRGKLKFNYRERSR